MHILVYSAPPPHLVLFLRTRKPRPREGQEVTQHVPAARARTQHITEAPPIRFPLSPRFPPDCRGERITSPSGPALQRGYRDRVFGDPEPGTVIVKPLCSEPGHLATVPRPTTDSPGGLGQVTALPRPRFLRLSNERLV